ncbi:alpha/beta fold hydrolase [Candidatus Neomarinimicrobiota bacterium]
MIAKKLLLTGICTTLCLLLIGCAGQQPTFSTTFDGVRIYYVAAGDGSPALVFVHGWLADMAVWDQQMTAFSKTNTVVSLDLPGHGQSSVDRLNWTMTNYGRDVATLVEQLGLEEVILVGHSMGAAVVVEAALMMPEAVIGIVVVDNFREVETEYTEEEIHEAVNSRSPGFAQLIRENPNLIMAKSAWIGSYMEYLRWYGNSLTDGLEALRVSIYAINADYAETNVDMARKYAASFNLKIIEGTGHVIMLEAPDKFNDALREIISEWSTSNVRDRN